MESPLGAQNTSHDTEKNTGQHTGQNTGQYTRDMTKQDSVTDFSKVVTTKTDNSFYQNQVLNFKSRNRKIQIQFVLRDRGSLHRTPVFFAFNQRDAEPLFS